VPKTGGIPTTKARVVKWLKQEGDPVKVGEPVVELETDKVSYDLESTAEGVMLKILAAETAEVPVGDPLCHIGQPGEIAVESSEALCGNNTFREGTATRDSENA
jgi:pyruvate dehydrogenase E2 component (dihydrolipoamide acetyltransferase)